MKISDPRPGSRRQPGHLLNTAEVEIWPGGLLQARANHDARLLARARRVLRRKRDGRYLAAMLPEGIVPLLPGWKREPGIDEALRALHAHSGQLRPGAEPVPSLPLHRLHERLAALGVDAGDYASRTGLHLVAEPAWLAFAGLDRYRRALWLHEEAADAWLRMREAARRDGVVLEAVSGYRNHDYQLGIFARKRARGEPVDRILRVNAAPGYSEHHSGLALDISAPGEPAAEESFESTAAFSWLQDKAARYGFHMSYPRDNPHGIVYEPWHWCFAPARTGAATPANA